MKQILTRLVASAPVGFLSLMLTASCSGSDGSPGGDNGAGGGTGMGQSCETKTIGECEDEGETGRDLCYDEFAAERGDVCLCTNIDHEATRALCPEEVALATGDASSCDRAGFPNQCRIAVAAFTGDSSICDGIEATFERDRCLEPFEVASGVGADCMLPDSCELLCPWQVATIRGDACVCDGLDGIDRSVCLQNVALSQRDSAPCLADERDASRDSCLQAVAVRTNDPATCQLLLDSTSPYPESRANLCLEDVAAFHSNAAACDLVGEIPGSTAEQERADCLARLENAR